MVHVAVYLSLSLSLCVCVEKQSNWVFAVIGRWPLFLSSSSFLSQHLPCGAAAFCFCSMPRLSQLLWLIFYANLMTAKN